MYLCIMKTIIFKSEKNAKVYDVRSVKNQGVYKENELLMVVKTDNIEEIVNDLNYEVRATEKTIG